MYFFSIYMHFYRPCLFSYGSIQMRFVLLSFSYFCFISNKHYQNLWMLLNLGCQKTCLLCKHNFLLLRTRNLMKFIYIKAKVFHESISCFMRYPETAFHEMLWKKYFTVYSCLYLFSYLFIHADNVLWRARVGHFNAFKSWIQGNTQMRYSSSFLKIIPFLFPLIFPD